MAPLYLILALLIQSSLTYAEVKAPKNETVPIEIVPEAEEVKTNPILESKIEEELSKVDDDNVIPKTDNENVFTEDFPTESNDLADMFLGSSSNLYPSSSASLMAQAVNSNKSPEEKLEEIKEAASVMTMAIDSEMNTLIDFALNYDKDEDGNKHRRRRSVETPMDSSQLVMRLLQHIKSNNEYQNIAIEKMMSAQEIADKYGVEFNPDPEILSDLAFAANEHAKELTSILQDACDPKNISCRVDVNATTKDQQHKWDDNSINVDNSTCYLLSNESINHETSTKSNITSQKHEHYCQPKSSTPANHVHYTDNHLGYNYYNYETQVPSPPVQYSYGPPVSTKPTFYDYISYNPNEYNMPYCSVDQMAYPSVLPFEEPLDLEPELIGEEYEETVSSRVIIEQDEEPGAATVNHVMTYTVSEKAHFRSPQVEKLPQQMQYYFFLM